MNTAFIILKFVLAILAVIAAITASDYDKLDKGIKKITFVVLFFAALALSKFIF